MKKHTPAPKKAPIKRTTPAKPIAVSEDKKWQAQDDMRTLKQAMEIKADSKRHEMAKAHAAEHVEILKKIAKSK